MSTPFPYEVIEKVVESLMWRLQNRLNTEDAAEAGELSENGETKTECHEVESSDSSKDDQAKQLNSASRKILREYVTIPLVSRSFRDAYLRFFTTLPALSYDFFRAPKEVRLYRRLPPPSAAAAAPHIVAAPGVVKMLAAMGRLGHLKCVHFTTTPRKYERFALGASSLQSLYRLLGIYGGAGKNGGEKKKGKNGRKKGKPRGIVSRGRELVTAGAGSSSSSGGGTTEPTPIPAMPHGAQLALDEAHVELCAGEKDALMALAFFSSSRVQLNGVLALNATSVHIGYASVSLSYPPNFYFRSTPSLVSDRITRLTLSVQFTSTVIELQPFPSRDWAALIERLLKECSGCRELCWEFVDERACMTDAYRSEAVRGMAEVVLPAIKSDAYVLIDYYFTCNFENESARQFFFKKKKGLFRFGRLVTQMDNGEGSGEMTREIIFKNERNGKGAEEEKKTGDEIPIEGDNECQGLSDGRRVVRMEHQVLHDESMISENLKSIG